ncbi:MAG: alpha/beta hydrolase [Candidatus Buchananbacteria bacterium]|nr:alpha/beta hydrolase [Candidatus Buchananbacteria bacterium]
MNAIILHGTGSFNTDYWFPDLKEKLEAKGFQVWLPQLPEADVPNLDDWVSFVLKNGTFNSETVLIGHSAGAQLILSILENIDVQIKQSILVSGYAQSLRQNKTSEEKPKLDWQKIKSHSQDFVFINSDNDPWGCDDVQGRIMFDHLGGMQIIKHDGHMGSTTYKQPYKEFPLLIRLVG